MSRSLYHTADLYEPGDNGWLERYPGPQEWAGEHVAIGVPRVHGDGGDILLVSWANGLYLSLRAARRLAAEGIICRIVDLRWIAPLPIAEVARQAAAVRAVLVVDETRRTGGVGEGVVTGLVEQGYQGPLSLVASRDSFIPLGEAALKVLVSEEEIMTAVRRILT